MRRTPRAQVDLNRHDRRGEAGGAPGHREAGPPIVEQRPGELCAKGTRELQNIQRQVLGAKCMKTGIGQQECP